MCLGEMRFYARILARSLEFHEGPKHIQGFVYVSGGRIQKLSSDGKFITRIGGYYGSFGNPHLAVDKSGNLYVLDINGIVQKFDSERNLISKWNLTNSVYEAFWGGAIAVDDEGSVYIGSSDGIRRFTNDGKFVSSLGSECTVEVHEKNGYGNDPCVDPDGSGPLEIGDGQFSGVSGIAFDSNGFMYVVDLGNYRIQKFAKDGRFVVKWGSKCLFASPPGDDSGCIDPDGTGPLQKGDGQFYNPISVAVSNDGFVYVVDSNEAVQKFTNDGKFISKWAGRCAIATDQGCVDPDADGPLELGDGQFSSPFGIAVDSNGFVYVVEKGNERVQKFTPDGKFVTKWGKPRTFDGLLSFPAAIAVDKEGYVYVAGGNWNRIQKFSSNGTFVLKWGFGGSEPRQLNFPRGITVSSDGYVYVADSGNNRVQKFTVDGKFVEVWHSPDLTELLDPDSIATDKDGNVYVFDRNAVIRKFDSEGRLLTKWGGFCTLYGYFVPTYSPIGDHGIPAGKGCIDPDLIGPLEFGDGQFMWGAKIAQDPSGYVYVSDIGNKRTQKFTIDGKLVAKFDYYGPIGTDESGNVYVAGVGERYVKKFDSNGSLLAKIGVGNLKWSPIALAVDSSGNIYVIGEYEVWKFAPVTG